MTKIGRTACESTLINGTVLGPVAAINIPQLCTETTKAIARNIVENEDMDAMPILADAIEEITGRTAFTDHLRFDHPVHRETLFCDGKSKICPAVWWIMHANIDHAASIPAREPIP